ncbi:helix-turn-helix domain-containing protein [Microbacterium sp. W4I20]|uniref:helix-turn-helix domain-containing protein n=1 Tax=Microbacterium sp. W4I20 TaxID=3042262 RepID=UPI00358F8193
MTVKNRFVISKRVRGDEARRLGGWLRSMRESRGLSQEALAHTADLSVSTYGSIERAFSCGRWANPKLDSLLRLIVALNTTSSELEVLLTHPTMFGPYSVDVRSISAATVSRCVPLHRSKCPNCTVDQDGGN